MAICANSSHYQDASYYTPELLESMFKGLVSQKTQKITFATFLKFYREAETRYNQISPEFWKVITKENGKIAVTIDENKLRLWLQKEGYRKYKPDVDSIGYTLFNL